MYERGSFTPTAKLTSKGNYSIISDYIGRAVQAYDASGKLVWSTDYDIYGDLTDLKGERHFVPFRQAGQYEDSETGLYYNRFRYYDPVLGTYLSKDPIGLEGRNPNLYGYVKDSNIWIDVFGLDLISLDEALQKACDFLEPNVAQKIDINTSGMQIIQTFEDSSGRTITRRVGIDINPESGHVIEAGPHLNLQTQFKGKAIKKGPLTDPHIGIDPSTIHANDIIYP